MRLLGSDVEPRGDVAGPRGDQRNVEFLVGGVRPITPKVVCDPTRASRDAEGTEGGGGLGADDAGRVEPGHHALRADHPPDGCGELSADRIERLGQGGESAAVEVGHEAAGGHEAGQVAVSGQRVVHSQEAFLQPTEPGDARVKADPGADVAEVADVVVEALQLGEQDAPPSGADWDLGLCQLLDRLRVCESVGNRADAAGPLDDRQRGGGTMPAIASAACA